MRPKISIIIINYHCEKPLLGCLKSIYEQPLKSPFEVIVVDNDEPNPRNLRLISGILCRSFPAIRYLKSPGNIGFGAGSNQGAKRAKGEFLFFLNPDTIVPPKTIEKLLDFMEENEERAMVAPLLLDENKQFFPLQIGRLTPANALIVFSFINKYWPNNPLSSKFWLTSFDRTEPFQVETIPGTAFCIRKEAFEEIGGFDEHIFLYFEEHDLCKRIRQSGKKIFILPTAEIIHLGQKSTADNQEAKKIFSRSRFYYFRKHWGFLPAVVVESFLRSTEWLAEKI